MNKEQIKKSLKSYPEALTVKEVAEILRVSTKLVYQLIKENKIPATNVGREKRIAKSRIIHYLRTAGTLGTNPNAVLSDKTRGKS